MRKGEEEGKGKGGKGSVEFHHLLLCNLTTMLTFVMLLFYADAATLSRISRDIRAAYSSMSSFDAHWAMIVTWYRVTFFGTNATPPPVSVVVLGRYHISVNIGIVIVSHHRFQCRFQIWNMSICAAKICLPTSVRLG